jgi:SAM-dependent methyltransferase
VGEDWFRTFFDRAANDHWNAALPPEWTAGEVDFLVDRLRLEVGDRVLDLPAGRGRLAAPLAGRGFRIVAVDLSVDGMQHARAAGLPAVLADMRTVPMAGRCVDAAFCLGNSFGYFSVEGVERFLGEVARVVRPGGRFALESATVAESMATSAAEHTVHEFGGVRVEGRHTRHGDRIVSDLTITDGDGTRTATIDQLSLTSAHIADLVEAAGLRVDALLGDVAGTPYDATAGRLLVVAER